MNSASIHSATAVREDEVIRYTFAERIGHWVNAAAYVYLLGSGLALFTPFFGGSPLYWAADLRYGFGTHG